jgi:uncharacterized repeat protein (TIGR01451 family)
MLFKHSTRLAAWLVVAVFVGAMSLLTTFEVHSRTDDPVQGVMEQYRIVRAADGKEARQSAANIKPGETLEYVVRYTNVSAAALNQFVVTLPIPQGLELLPQSDQPRAVLASTDGVAFNEMPLKRRVMRSNGAEVVEAVPLAEYRALRWQVGQLAAGKSVQFAARAKVDSTTSGTAR